MPNNSGALLLLPLALIGGLWAIASAGSRNAADQPALSRETLEETLAERQEKRRFFQLLMRPVLNDLSAGKIGLRAAGEKLVALSLQYHEEFLNNVAITERGATALESMARNCIRQIHGERNEKEFPLLTAEIGADLERQLAVLILEEKQRKP